MQLTMIACKAALNSRQRETCFLPILRRLGARLPPASSSFPDHMANARKLLLPVTSLTTPSACKVRSNAVAVCGAILSCAASAFGVSTGARAGTGLITSREHNQYVDMAHHDHSERGCRLSSDRPRLDEQAIICCHHADRTVPSGRHDRPLISSHWSSRSPGRRDVASPCHVVAER